MLHVLPRSQKSSNSPQGSLAADAPDFEPRSLRAGTGFNLKTLGLVFALSGSMLMAQTATAQTHTFTSQINSGNDDAEESITSGSIDLTSSDLELTEDGGTNQLVGMRFTGIALPVGAIITKAYIQFSVDEIHSPATNVVIKGLAADNAASFSSSTHNISSRPTTTASVNWAIPHWPVLDEAGPLQQTPDIKDIINEIVTRPGFASGNAVSLIITGSGRRNAHAYNGSAAMAPKLVIEYINTIAPVGTLPMPQHSIWSYNDQGLDLGTAWITPAYHDSLWAFGPGVLGYSNPNTTTLSFGPDAGNKFITYYFRHKFSVTDAHKIDSLAFNIMRDDGAVVYLNGVEQFRSNMPAGPVNYLTHSATIVDGANETTYFQYKVKAGDLVQGLNVLAVEVHQRDGQSSDLSFDMSIDKIMRTDEKLIAAGSDWKYLDNGVNLGAAWTAASFADSAWATGAATLGYGNGDETTTVSAGPDDANKHITTYFRKNFSVTDTMAFESLRLKLKRDDGAVVYINGTEVMRSNMLNGPVTYQTTALSAIEGADEDAWIEAIISKSHLLIGNNTIAVEIHKFNHYETDKRFDLELELTVDQFPLSSTVNFIDCDPNSSDAIGCFTSVKPGPQQQHLVFPSETHSFQLLAKTGLTAYNDGTTGTIGASNDFTAYVGKNGSSKEGYLSINHETSPGGVSLLNLALDETTMTWQVDSVRKVNFAPVVQTQTNCSGGITPWGTVISSEENFSTGDANGDGYQDRGWQVEIDPVTGKVNDHDGDGQPDKLWALGRMSHENIAIGNDSVTVYQTEDGGSSGVYKFIANQPGNLSEGTLYVLKRDSATATTGTWIVVPNTTQADRNNTRTLASSLGGTNWSGAEDIEFGPDGKMYFTSKGTGTIWRFKDDGTTVSEIEAWVTNQHYPISHAGGTQMENFGTGIDNLTFDGEGNLWALQDGGRAHLWIIRPDHTTSMPHIDLFLTAPAGSESTGLTFSPDYRYGFISFQHPSGSNSAEQIDAAGNVVKFNNHSTVVFARKQYLGAGAVKPEFALAADTAICDGASLVINGPSGNDITAVWNDGTTGAQKTITAAGTFTVTAYANNGQTYTDSISVTTNPLPVADLGADLTLCATQTLLDAGNAGNGNTFMWSDGSTTQTLTAASTGTYAVTVTNSATGCAATDEVQVTLNADPVVNLGPDVTMCATCNMVLNAGFGFSSYNWNTGETTPTITATQTGDYIVTVTNAAGCSASDTLQVTIVSGMLDAETAANMVDVYPNPFASETNIKLSLTESTEIAGAVYDVTGKEVIAINPVTLPQGTHEFPVNLGNGKAAQGVYMLRIWLNGTVVSKRLVIQ